MIRKSLHLAAAFAAIFLACGPLFAARTLVDNFNVGAADIERWGNPAYGSLQDTYQSVAGPIGGIRQIHVADAHNGTVNNPSAMTINTTNGTLEWWGGATAPAEYVAYGSAASGGGGTALGLSKLVTDGFVIDIPHSTAAGRTDGTLSITLNIGAGGGGGTVSWSSTGHEVAGTKVVPLSAFTGITSLKAANIDGITINGQASYFTNGPNTLWPSSQGRGLALDNVQIAPILTSTSSGNWGTAGTWSTPRATVSDDYVQVNNTVTVAAAGAVAQDVALTQAGSNLTVNAGSSLSASGTLWVNTGSLSATNGGLTAGTLKVSGGTASVGGGGALGTVNASAGTTNLGTNVTTAINVSGTAALNLTSAVSAPSATVSQLGGSMNTGGNFLSLSNQLKLGDTNSITTTSSFGVKGSAISNSLSGIQTLQLSGGTTTVKAQVPNTIGLVDNFPVFTNTGTNNQVINVSPTAKVLIVQLGSRGGGPTDPTSVTYNGTPLTLAKQMDYAANLNYTGSQIWYLYNPVSGSHTLTVNAAVLQYTGAASTLSNVNTSTNPELTWVNTDGANTGSGTAFPIQNTLSVTLDNLVAGSAVAATQNFRQGSGTVAWTSSTGSLSPLFTSSQSQIYTAGELILNTSAGSTTVTGTNASGIRQTLVAAAFAPTLKDGSINMPTTTVDVTATTTLNLSAAPATTATFGDLQMDAGTLSFTSAPPSVTFSNIKATGTSTVAAGTGIDLSGGQIDVDPLAVLTVNAVVGGTNVTKIGTGKVVLAGNDTYTGTTTVNNGTLAINGTHAAGAGNLTVNSNGRLQGSGGTDADLFVVGGTVAPGNSIQSLGTGSISFIGGTYEYELDTSLTPGDTADLLYGDNGSTLSLTGSPTLSLIDLGGNFLLPIGTKFTLIAYDTPWDGTSIFDTYANNSIFLFAGNYWTIKYDDTVAGVNFTSDATATDSTFVTITTVELASPAPEPSTFALAGLSLVGLGCVVLRKKYRRA